VFPDARVLTWNELAGIRDAGHEIASHGTRHVDLSLSTDSEVKMELLGSHHVFRSKGFDTSTYACAFNCYTRKADDMIDGLYRSIRGFPGKNFLPVEGHVYHVCAGNSMKELEDARENQWIIGVWHDVDPKRFESDVVHVKKTGVRVATVGEMMP
jgi:peptidoglycan/xylan/chitin deacetylase (PgdA/CDA1 family)